MYFNVIINTLYKLGEKTMHDYKILTPGEKIKIIRKELKLKQYEIVGSEITRNMISFIENNKANLTPQVASIICKNINDIAKSRNLDFHVDEAYLLESVEDQAVKVITNYMETFEDITGKKLPPDFENTISEIEKLLLKHDLRRIKTKVYRKIARIYLLDIQYSKAYTFLIKAYENSTHLPSEFEQINLLNEISYCCLKLEKYMECIEFGELIETYMEELKELSSKGRDLLYKIVFNNALAYKRLNKPEKALQEIEKLQSSFNLTKHYEFNLLTLKSNCYRDMGYYNNSLKLQEKLLSSLPKDDIEDMLITVCNIIEIYIILGDFKAIREYLKTCMSLIDSYEKTKEKYYSEEIYNDLGRAFNEIGNELLSKEYFFKALEAAKKCKNPTIALNTLEALIDFAAKTNDTTLVNTLRNELFECISLDIITKNSSIIFKFISYYNELKDNDNIKGILRFILK